MPIVLIPVHFDRDPIDHIPSCQRSVVIRTFITNDFMTGVPATPGKHIPLEVGKRMFSSRSLTTPIAQVLLERTDYYCGFNVKSLTFAICLSRKTLKFQKGVFYSNL